MSNSDSTPFSGKKILILGGAEIHCKLIRAAKEMGLYTIVTDYNSVTASPGKQLADKSYQIDVFDIKAVVDMCRTEEVDAVLSTSLDPCQLPYQKICECLRLPCYCENEHQVHVLTDKDAFKALCIENGVDVIPSYYETDMDIVFPVLVKPALSRGSKSVVVCRNRAEMKTALTHAKMQSENGRALIEKYMGNADDFTVTYFFVDGEPYLIKIGDRFLGTTDSGMDRNCIASIYPSKYTKMYMERVNDRMKQMLKKLGIRNGPVFFQGFVDNDTVRFYDPGFRFPGAEYETMLKQVTEIDFMKIMVEFAMTGKMNISGINFSDDIAMLRGKVAGMWLPTVGAGTVGRIIGFEALNEIPGVVCYTVRHKPGDVIRNTGDVNHLLCEINMVAENLTEYRRLFHRVQDTIHVFDDEGRDMMISPFRPEQITASVYGEK